MSQDTLGEAIRLQILGTFCKQDSRMTVSTVGSTAFREKLHNNDETAKELVTQEIWEILNRNEKIPFTEYALEKSKGMGRHEAVQMVV